MNIDEMSLAEMLVKERPESVLISYRLRIVQHITSLNYVRRDLEESITYGLDADDILANLTRAIDLLERILDE